MGLTTTKLKVIGPHKISPSKYTFVHLKISAKLKKLVTNKKNPACSWISTSAYRLCAWLPWHCFVPQCRGPALVCTVFDQKRENFAENSVDVPPPRHHSRLCLQSLTLQTGWRRLYLRSRVGPRCPPSPTSAPFSAPPLTSSSLKLKIWRLHS